MKAVVAAFNQEKALVGAFSVITNLRMELFEALVQATIVLRAEEGSGDTIPQEYINTFSPFEARAALVEELDTLHDLFKTTLRKHAPITNTNFIPVHAVLNGLPKVHYCEITHNFTAQC